MVASWIGNGVVIPSRASRSTRRSGRSRAAKPLSSATVTGPVETGVRADEVHESAARRSLSGSTNGSRYAGRSPSRSKRRGRSSRSKRRGRSSLSNRVGRAGRSSRSKRRGRSSRSNRVGRAGRSSRSKRRGRSSRSKPAGRAGRSSRWKRAGRVARSSRLKPAGRAGRSSRSNRAERVGRVTRSSRSNRDGRSPRASRAGRSSRERAAYREVPASLEPDRGSWRGARSERGGLPAGAGACPRCGFLGPDLAADFWAVVQRAFLGAPERLGVGMRWISYFR